MKVFKIIGLSVLGLCIVGAGAYFVFSRSGGNSSEAPPQFIEANFIDLNKVYAISKFRSGAGHDFAGNGEKCRSMKHYFEPQPSGQGRDVEAMMRAPDPSVATAIYSPVAGKITKVQTEQTPIGKQVYIRPAAAPGFTIRLFHVHLLDSIKEGTSLTAGQLIGYLNPEQGTDIAIQSAGMGSQQLYSYFDVLPDSLFAAYKARGAMEKSDFIITKEARDANPLQCRGEQFAGNNDRQTDDDYVFLSGYRAISDDSSQGQDNTHDANNHNEHTETPSTQSGSGSGAGGGKNKRAGE